MSPNQRVCSRRGLSVFNFFWWPGWWRNWQSGLCWRKSGVCPGLARLASPSGNLQCLKRRVSQLTASQIPLEIDLRFEWSLGDAFLVMVFRCLKVGSYSFNSSCEHCQPPWKHVNETLVSLRFSDLELLCFHCNYESFSWFREAINVQYYPSEGSS